MQLVWGVYTSGDTQPRADLMSQGRGMGGFQPFPVSQKHFMGCGTFITDGDERRV